MKKLFFMFLLLSASMIASAGIDFGLLQSGVQAEGVVQVDTLPALVIAVDSEPERQHNVTGENATAVQADTTRLTDIKGLGASTDYGDFTDDTQTATAYISVPVEVGWRSS